MVDPTDASNVEEGSVTKPIALKKALARAFVAPKWVNPAARMEAA